jgi:3-methyl-2-oxobutanoate hydroxymethyltransferase
MLGLSPRVPKFVKRFGDLGPSIEQAIRRYAEEVKARSFPGPDHVYPMREATVAKLPERGKGPSRA